MSHSDLFGVVLTLTVIGLLPTVFELSPVARTKFAQDWIYSGVGRKASRALSFAVLGLGLVLLMVAGLWSLVA